MVKVRNVKLGLTSFTYGLSPKRTLGDSSSIDPIAINRTHLFAQFLFIIITASVRGVLTIGLVLCYAKDICFNLY